MAELTKEMIGKPTLEIEGYVKKEEYDQLVTWISEIAKAVNLLHIQLEELRESKEPTENIKL